MKIDCLKRKVLGLDSEVYKPIAKVHVLNYEPWNLPHFWDPYWYFFCILHEYHATVDFPNPVDTLSHVELEAILGCDAQDCNLYFEQLSQLYTKQGPSYQDLPSSNGFSSDCNGAQTQSGTIESGEDFALLDLYLIIKCEANPEETISRKNLVVESEGLVWGVIGVFSTHPLESFSGILYVEDGGMSRDTYNQVAIAQAREVIKHVTVTTKKNSVSQSNQKCKNEHEVELEWAKPAIFTRFSLYPRLHHS